MMVVTEILAPSFALNFVLSPATEERRTDGGQCCNHNKERQKNHCDGSRWLRHLGLVRIGYGFGFCIRLQLYLITLLTLQYTARIGIIPVALWHACDARRTLQFVAIETIESGMIINNIDTAMWKM